MAWADVKGARLRRRRKILSLIARRLPVIRLLLLCAGFVWLLILPSSFLGRGIYIDENALQPSQVATYWNWAEVHEADNYLQELEGLMNRNASSDERDSYIKRSFEKLGLHAGTQGYNISTPYEVIQGTNAYAVFSSPRTSGNEAMVVSASWLSRMGEGTLNLRGVATVLALAGHTKHFSHWARDLIFVIGDDYLTGMHAWLSAYHADVQNNLECEPVNVVSGTIWTALNIDYPGHSFSHLGAFHEGLNGRLPNQDLFNSFDMIARYTGGVPVVLYDHLDPRETDRATYPPTWIPSFIRNNPISLDFLIRARNIVRHMYYQALGKGSGVHGLYHRYRIDAITIFAVPAEGPYGFHSIGKTIESTLRTMNNLLERLHASFFFYILTKGYHTNSHPQFLKIGHYLPSVILISVSTMFTGLRVWVDAGWVRNERKEEENVIDTKRAGVQKGEEDGTESPYNKSDTTEDEWTPRRRPVLDSVLILLATHAVGFVIFFLASRGLAFKNGFLEISWKPNLVLLAIGKFLILSNGCVWLLSRVTTIKSDAQLYPVSLVLKSIILCVSSAIVSIMSLLNFSFAALLCVCLILPLTILLPKASDSRSIRDGKHSALILYTMVLLSVFVREGTLWDWTVLSVWFSPFICIVCCPLLLAAAVCCA